MSVITIPASKLTALRRLPLTAVFTLLIIEMPASTKRASTVQII